MHISEESYCRVLKTFWHLQSDISTLHYLQFLCTISTTCTPLRSRLCFSLLLHHKVDAAKKKADKTTEKLFLSTTAAVPKLTKLSPLLIHFRCSNVISWKLLFWSNRTIWNQQLYRWSKYIYLFISCVFSTFTCINGVQK